MDLAEARQCGLELEAEELLDRQWEFFTEELTCETSKKLIGDWTDELYRLGPQILDKPDAWVEWCAECLEMDEKTALMLAEYLRHSFDNYKDNWV